MSTINHPSVDVAIVGAGVMGGEIAVRLTRAGHTVVAMDKGPYWNYQTDFAINKYDEWGVQLLGKFDSPLPQSTVTLRNNSNQFAPVIRRNTTGQSTHSGYGVSGAAHH